MVATSRRKMIGICDLPTLKRLFTFFLFLVWGVVLTSCSKQVTWPPPPLHSAEFLEDKSIQIQADIYYDATLSMQGFTKPGIATAYAQVLNELEGSITSGWASSVVRFYRFGTKIKELKGRDHLLAITPKFFTDKELLQETLMSTVIDSAKTQHLTVIVTDLFLNNADVTQLVNKLRDKFLARGFAVGIIGVQSEFAGTVYDVGINRDQFEYAGQRPFYVLAVGKHRDIENFYLTLQARILNRLSDTHFLLLSSYFSSAMPTFENGQITLKTDIDEVENIFPHDVIDHRVEQLRIKSKHQSSQIGFSLSRTSLRYAMALNPSAIETELSMRMVGSVNGKDSLVLCDNAAELLTVNGFGLTDSSLQFMLSFNNNENLSEGVYVIQQVVRPKPHVDLMPTWISDWDMDITKLPSWKADTKDFDGQKTLNLKKFAFEMWQTIIQTQSPEILHLFYYLRKE